MLQQMNCHVSKFLTVKHSKQRLYVAVADFFSKINQNKSVAAMTQVTNLRNRLRSGKQTAATGLNRYATHYINPSEFQRNTKQRIVQIIAYFTRHTNHYIIQPLHTLSSNTGRNGNHKIYTSSFCTKFILQKCQKLQRKIYSKVSDSFGNF